MNTEPAPAETVRFDRRAEAPLYAQVRDDLRRAINSGRYTQGEAIPPEPELGASYGVSRITIRRAVAELVAEGMLEKILGKGTFVRQLNFSPSLVSVSGFGTEDEHFEDRPRRRVLRKWTEVADARIAHRLGLNPGDPLLCLERLLQDGDKVLAIDTTRYSADLLPDFLDEIHDDVSTLAVIRGKYGISVGGAAGVLCVAAASVREGGFLGCQANDPIITVDKVIMSSENRPLVHSQLAVNPRRVSMQFCSTEGGPGMVAATPMVH